MIKKHILGDPFHTGAVTEVIHASTQEYPAFLHVNTEEGFSLSYKMADEDIVYGLGETVRGLNKRGWFYTSDCLDEKDHFEDKNSLYCAHNFLIIAGERNFGLFFDYPGIIHFDIGYTLQNELSVFCKNADLTFYIIEETSPSEIVHRFRKMIGQSYAAPRWAFGYQQSRWGYGTKNDLLEVANRYQELGIPLDSIGMDIDYMERYKDFTVDSNKFPDFPQLVSDLKNRGIRLVPIIDAGVKAEEGYPVYEEGVANNYFCKREDGTDFSVGVWPGRSHFPDVMNENARKWFGEWYKVLTSQGIEGFWNDMNEPAIFYSEEGLKEAWDKIDQYRNCELDVTTFFELESLFANAANNPADYTRFYHNIDGRLVRHDEVHNLFGFYMTKAAWDGLREIFPKKRFLLFSRSSYVGMHRFGGTWTGDNKAWWSHILMNLKMLPSLNMCGFLFTGADLGGFAGNTTRDLMLRWIALGVFTPLMRNHARSNTRKKEFYQFEHPEDFSNLLKVRYALIPYLYSEYMKAVLNDEMMFRPLAFDYPADKTARNIEDQMMLGDGLMITPVYEQNAQGRLVYLPEDMLFVKFRSDIDYSMEKMEPGCHFINVSLNEIPIFVKKNHLLPIAKAACCTDNLDTSTLTVFGHITKPCSYSFYEDDGDTIDYGNQKFYTQINAEISNCKTQINCNPPSKLLNNKLV